MCGQRCNGFLELRFVFPVYPAAFRRGGVPLGQLRILQILPVVGKDKGCGPIFAEPVISCATHNRQHPGARISIGKIADSVQCSQAGILYHVLRVGVIAGEPTG